MILKSYSDNSTKYLKKTEELIKPIYEPLFEKEWIKLNLIRQITKLKPSLNNDIKFDSLNYKVFTVNDRIKRGVNYYKFKINSNKFDRNKLFIKSDKNVDVMFLYFSVESMKRIIGKK